MNVSNDFGISEWNIRKMTTIAVLGFAAIQIAANAVSLVGMQRVLDDSQTIMTETTITAGKVHQLNVNTNQLKEKYIPLLLATQDLLQATSDVNHEILRFVTEDSEDTGKLITAHDLLSNSFARVRSKWIDQKTNDIVMEMGANISLVNDIVIELLETDSPTQLEELDEDARSSSASIILTSYKLREMLYSSIERISSEINTQSSSVKQSVYTSRIAASSSADNTKLMTTAIMLFSALLILTLITLALIFLRVK